MRGYSVECEPAFSGECHPLAGCGSPQTSRRCCCPHCRVLARHHCVTRTGPRHCKISWLQEKFSSIILYIDCSPLARHHCVTRTGPRHCKISWLQEKFSSMILYIDCSPLRERVVDWWTTLQNRWWVIEVEVMTFLLEC